MMKTIEPARPAGEIQAVINDLRSKYIALERDKALREAIDRLLARDTSGNTMPQPVKFTATGETRGIAVYGEAGSGKTSLVHRAIFKHPVLQPSKSAPMPCVSITVPNPATLKSVGLTILRETGYPELAKKRMVWEIWTAVQTRFALLGTTVLLIDEAHDLFRKPSQSQAGDVLKTLKSLMQGPGAVIVVLSGITSLWDNISFDDQVDRRFSKFELPAVNTSADRKLVWGLLCAYCDRAGVGRPEQSDLVERLVHAARQRLGLCIEQIIAAIEMALMRGDNVLHVQHFADAFFRQESCGVADNVFLVPNWSSIKAGRRGLATAC
jgi:type II secretory pathway predicted ATPase ExeA